LVLELASPLALLRVAGGWVIKNDSFLLVDPAAQHLGRSYSPSIPSNGSA
jgi:hypothetical protein